MKAQSVLLVRNLFRMLVEYESSFETEEQLLNKIQSSPASFLHRYGFLLTETERESLFEEFAQRDWTVRCELLRLKKQRGNASSCSEVVKKNRRFVALNELLQKGEYFSNEAMEQRDPLLYHRLWGRFTTSLSENERNKILQLTGEVNGSSLDNFSAKDQTSYPLTKYLMTYFLTADIGTRRWKQRRKEKYGADMHSVNTISCKRIIEPVDTEQIDYVEEQRLEQESDEEEQRIIENSSLEEICEYRKELLSIMKCRFLNAEDVAFFDYDSVDNDERYDDLNQIQNDMEEKYFDEQEPEWMTTIEEEDVLREE